MGRHFDRSVGARAEMSTDLVVCYLCIITSAILTVIGFPRERQDLVNHFLLHGFFCSREDSFTVKVTIKLGPHGAAALLVLSKRGVLASLSVQGALTLDKGQQIVPSDFSLALADFEGCVIGVASEDKRLLYNFIQLTL